MVYAQKLAPDTYWIQFTDKQGTPYSIDQPGEFLSDKALERRATQNIPVKTTDLPVSPAYTDSLSTLGMDILYTSKWLNAAVVQSYDSLLIDTIEQYGFISNYHKKIQTFSNWFTSPKIPEIPYALHQVDLPDDSVYNYGDAARQIKMLNGDLLHNKAYRGQDMTIAVLDAGFYRVNEFPAFDSLRNENRIADTWDFVRNSPLSYRTSSHGMKVLSTMAGNIPGVLIGTAPKANYCLYRTENAASEYMIEEANWIAAAEKADSAGVDVINTSLGYSDFDDPEMSHSYDDMDGRSTLISIAADMAVAKGIAVVSSAGNEGESAWKHITAPADAYHVISVAAVDAKMDRVFFSSVGPSVDGRVKPDVAAQGYFTAVQSFTGEVGFSNGTSFAAPVTAGMVASLWQARPELTSLQLINIVRKASSRYMNPDSLLGYGIPDFGKAYYYPSIAFVKNISFKDLLSIYPNPFEAYLKLDMDFASDRASIIQIYSLVGKKVLETHIPASQSASDQNTIIPIKELTEGVYILQVINGKHKYQQKIIKQ